MKIHHLSAKNTIMNQFLGEIRNVAIHTDRMRFRRNIERIGEIMAYEISKELEYTAIDIQTPLGIKQTSKIKHPIVITSILRAGLPFHQGFLNIFDNAENGFISAARYHSNADDAFEIKVEYEAIADITSKYVVIADPMLATGQSIVAVFNKVIEKGYPKEIHLAVVIAAPEGIAHLEKELPENCHLWIASLDEKLDDRFYIVPGLGDAGDLAYGPKL
ncbi:uracil phosphoribosyltransferase [Flavobacterium algicola]|uniref:uracil phosphoribosyltransferase n=1 Tax=Flavobacterium algicola TaxID=556529 RepID=UPI001EFD2B31|nr:uracil phosphoribosyltransferase [Flavobacterium algicola]MCG9791825.1 uracil phosphoribosyltransferase [Flavobacterium algicola]